MNTTLKWFRRGLWLLFAGLCGVTIVASSTFLYLSPKLPSVAVLRDVRLQTPLRIYTKDGSLMAEFGEKKRTPVNLDEVPKEFISAFLAAEDDRFYSHNGVDVPGLLRATLQLVTSLNIQSGGSTITMQVAKNFFLSRTRAFSRKFNEILLALEIERQLDKDEIMELYLNKIFLGNRAYGVEAAAQVYYGRSVSELTLAQMAMIAGLPKAPSRYNPLASPERSLLRRNWILERMLRLGYIDQETYSTAVATPLTAQMHGTAIDVYAPYAAEDMRRALTRVIGEDIYTDGYEVYSTIDPEQQKAATEALLKGLHAYDERHGYRGAEQNVAGDPALWEEVLAKTAKVGPLLPAIVTEVGQDYANLLLNHGQHETIEWAGVQWARRYMGVNRQGASPNKISDVLKVGQLIRVRKTGEAWRLAQVPQVQGALVALDTENGAVRAMVGGYSFGASHYNRVIQAHRQVGSAFKPFVYAAALSRGVTPATLINDAPVVFDDDQLESYWRPQNDNKKFYGPTRVREGLYRSRNLVSIRLLQRTGISYATDFISRFGLSKSSLPNNLSLALGSASQTPLDIAQGYSVIANGGFEVMPHLVERVVQQGKNVMVTNAPVACRDCPLKDEDRDDEPPQESLSEGLVQESPLYAGLEPATEQQEATQKVAKRVMDARVNYLIYSMMQDVIDKGTGRRAKVLQRSDLAGKTGTTNDQQDLWFSGFNPKLQATVWMGFDQPAPLGRSEYGANAVLPIWIDFMKKALGPVVTVPQPAGIVTMRINPTTGRPAHPGESGSIFEVFRVENAPALESRTDSQYGDEQEYLDPGDIL